MSERRGSVASSPRVVTYDVVDSFDTVFDPGVFAASLRDHMPVLAFSHSWSEPIGRAIRVVRDDGKGLELEFRVDNDPDVPTAKRVFAQLKSGTLSEVSVGFRAIDSYQGKDQLKHFKRADLDEVSVVLRGAVPGSEVLAVRAADRRRRLHLDYLAGRANVATWRRATGALGVAAGDDDEEVIAAADDALDKLGL